MGVTQAMQNGMHNHHFTCKRTYCELHEQVCGSDNPKPEYLTLKLTGENKTYNSYHKLKTRRAQCSKGAHAAGKQSPMPLQI